MILQALTSYYEELSKKGEIPRFGWGKVRVQYALEIDADGKLLDVLPLEDRDEKGKPVPRHFELPAPVKRSVNIDANFLWDNSAYLLGFDSKGNLERAAKCFECSKELHLRLLNGTDEPFSKAVRAFFGAWTPEACAENEVIAAHLDELSGGANLTFMFNETLPDNAPALAKAWQTHYNGGADGDEGTADIEMRCLVTGEETAPVAIHPSIMRVRGAQSSGAALVSFNAPAFCSYEREQNYNAPVSKYAAFAYTTALNQLVADSNHAKLFGDTTVVYWAADGEAQYQDAFGCFVEGSRLTDGDLKGVMDALASGKNADFEGLPLRPDNDFYVLGLAPNATRLSVRFFLKNNFGDFAKNLKEHYDRLEIVRPDYDKDAVLSLWKMLRETVNPNSRDKSASPQMAGDTLRAILTGGRYPATLFQQALLRIRAERGVTRGKAAIIRAILIRNTNDEKYKEAATVALNEESNFAPYVLGRLFSVLENIQDSASGASTVKDRYFNSACATPAVVFPQLLKLKNSHMKVLMREKAGLGVTLEKQVTDLLARLNGEFPKHFLLPEQGAFILGYYHQTQKRYEKKN